MVPLKQNGKKEKGGVGDRTRRSRRKERPRGRKRGKEEQEERREMIPKRRKRIWPFGRNLSRIFIRKYLENDAYDEDQREFLLHCLEEGDTAEEMEQYAIPALSVTMMERLRKLVKERS